MTLRRLVTIIIAVALALPLALVLYVAFGDLSLHKGRIEALVTESVGRPFAIDGAFALEVLPQISVLAERVRLGNAQWGSQPQMVEVGRFSTRIGLWSLVSGPVDVRSLELSDVSVVLEKDPDGTGNWVFGEPKEPAQAADALGPGAAEVPAVILNAKLDNVRVTYREPKKPDRVALLETFTIAPGSDGLLAISGKGRLDDYPATLAGEVGPLGALVAGRDIRMKLQAALGNLRLDVNGGIGRLDPLDGANLALKVENPDLGTMLKNLRLPAFATGPLKVVARLQDAGELTRLDLEANLGDITAKLNGTLRTLGLPGSDLKFEASVADAARVAAAFDVAGLPAGRFDVGGRIASSRTEIKLDGMHAQYAGAKAKAAGTIRVARDPGAALRFELAAESLARLRQGLPTIRFSMNGNYAGNRAKVELKDLKGRIGESKFSGRASLVQTGQRRVEAELASPGLDLTPFFAQELGGEAKSKASAGAKQKPPPNAAKRKFVFGEEPLPLGKLKALDAKLHFAVGELKLAAGTLKDVDGALKIGGGQLAFEGRARGGVDGTLSGSVTLAPKADGAADLDLKLAASGLRAGLGAGGAIAPGETPATGVEVNLQARGASARQIASSANGRLLVTMGPGKIKSGLLGVVGGDLIDELAGKLNPFAAQDPHTQLDCVVTKADIVDGHVTLKPVLMQSAKVTVVAQGGVDLHTEELTLHFNTRPRKGVGISAGMFTNPFIELAGTLASPRIAVSAKGTAAAAATGGMTVLAQGVWDRIRGGQDVCGQTLAEAGATSK